MSETALAKVNGQAAPMPLSAFSSIREKIDTIKQTVARGATDAQLEMFLSLCERYQLDPFLKELWYVQGVGVVTSRDGYLKVAQRDPGFDGIQSFAVCKGDDFELDAMTPTVRHKFGIERGPVIGAYAVVFHKQRRPCVCFASLAEYKKSSSVWNTYTSAMICKVAEAQALKRQFGISGLVTEEEIGTESPTAEPTKEEAKAAQREVLTAKLAEVPAEIRDKYPQPVVAEVVETEAVDPAITGLWKRMAEGKFEALKVFGELKGAFVAVIGSEYEGHAEYYQILNKYGAEKADQFKKRGDAKAAARDMYERLVELKAKQEKAE